MTKIYCENCGKRVPLEIDHMRSDDLNGDVIWGDLVCSKCKLVIATLEVDSPGIYEFVKVSDI
jgi:transcription initiation factor TFIIIB Brf1 subunit/transcription initiation factor TFIIB